MNYRQTYTMNRTLLHAVMGKLLSALALCTLVVYQAYAATEIESIKYISQAGDRGTIRIDLTGPAPESRSFTIDQPPRLAIDLPNVALGSASRSVDLNSAIARSLQVAEAGDRTRVVIKLTSIVPYDIRSEANAIYISLNDRDAGQRSEVSSGVNNVELDRNRKDELKSIDFRRSDEGGGQIKVVLEDPTTSIDIQQKGSKIVANFLNTKLPKSLVRRLDVVDFATPVNNIDAYNTDKGARLEINYTGDVEHLAYQTDNNITITVSEIDKEAKEQEMKERFGYTGERLSLNFQNIEVRAVLQLLADFTGMNLVASDSVGGNITLRLKNVPWDQALDIILRTQGLGQRQKGNVLLIAPQEELAAQEQKVLEAKKQMEELAPLRTEFIEINYAKASEISSLLKQESNSLLSERGSVTVDERTNTLMVLDTDEKLAEVRRLVERLDVAVKQVMIESRIVVASDDFSRNLGVRWGSTSVGGTNSNDVFATSGSAAGTSTIATSAINNINSVGSAFPVSMPGQEDRLNVDLPATGAAGSIAFAILSSDYLVDLELSALQQEGRGEIVSNPRVITSNQKAATIEQGVEIPYQEASSSGATSVSFKKAVLSLEVTPQITPDERVTMDLAVSNDSVGTIVNGIPTINTRAVNTRVLVNNGDTVVLGGIYEETTTVSKTKVPFLGDIPLLGYLFRRTQRENSKTELLIFVTPKILKDGVVAVNE